MARLGLDGLTQDVIEVAIAGSRAGWSSRVTPGLKSWPIAGTTAGEPERARLLVALPAEAAVAEQILPGR